MSLRHAQIDSTGTVVAIILWDGVTALNPPITDLLVGTDTANVGDTYANGVFTPGPLQPVPDVPVSNVPQSVSPVQIRLALAQQNLLTTVNNAVAAASQEIQTYWEYAARFDRANPLIAQMATSLGLSSATVDSLFILAATFT